MIPSETDREKIAEKLAARQSGYWKELKSQIQYFGKQTLFWFLIEDPQKMEEILAIFKEVAAEDLARFDQTEFEVSFIQITGGKKIVWDVVDDDELRGTFPMRPLGTHPAQFELGEDELF